MKHDWINNPKDDDHNHIYARLHVILKWTCRRCRKITWSENYPKGFAALGDCRKGVRDDKD
ncbi:MAG TPA: hypothetical protein ENI27_09790 [bacterium]|nr:hypothetical protein [bacterium]